MTLRQALARRVGAALLLSMAGSWLLLAQEGATLPSRLSDREFWTLSQALSEPGGTFQSDNLVSNELGFQKVLPDLSERHPPGGVYLGVGPEQNFTYIGALRPRVAFIVDVRRENRDLHLMYKALFELAADRADFVGLLFSRPRPDGLTRESSAADIFSAFAPVPLDTGLQRATLARIASHLTLGHRLALSEQELGHIGYVHNSFASLGPAITYSTRVLGRTSSTMPLLARFATTYAALMQATDANDVERSYLATEARFAVVQDLQIRNLIIPVVGNFAGPKALRAVGDWLRTRSLTVSAFYLSNVEDYLRSGGLMTTFCQNVASLPLDDTSDFIRSGGPRPPVATVQTATPRVTGMMISGVSGAPDGFVRLLFSDGTRRDIAIGEVSKYLPAGAAAGIGVSGNRLGSMRAETAGCAAPKPA